MAAKTSTARCCRGWRAEVLSRSRKSDPPSAPVRQQAADVSRRAALKIGLGLGAAAASLGEGCIQVPNHCAGAPPVDPLAADGGADGGGAVRAALRSVETIVVVMMENRSFDN